MKRALIVKKYWLDKIFDEGKTWEMRSTRTSIRGKIGLIESGSGLIVGEAIITGCEKVVDPHREELKKYHCVEDYETIQKYQWAWFLESPKRYEMPIIYDHPQGAVIWVNLEKTTWED